MNDQIKVGSLVSASSIAPIVTLEWGELKAQMTPAEARSLAMSLITTAQNAENETAVVALGLEIMGDENPDEQKHGAAVFLTKFRQQREAPAGFFGKVKR